MISLTPYVYVATFGMILEYVIAIKKETKEKKKKEKKTKYLPILSKDKGKEPTSVMKNFFGKSSPKQT
jgi:hypothetical protein